MEHPDFSAELGRLHRKVLDLKVDLADVKLLLALRRIEIEAKFNPNQPRVPRGNPRGGEWTSGGGRSSAVSGRTPSTSWTRIAEIREPSGDPLRVITEAPAHVQAFLSDNHVAVTRFLGAVQAAGGVAEMASGVGAVGAGAATSEVGVGIAVAGMGAWMVRNGYDNFSTGLRILMTGEPRETVLRSSLRGLGLSERDASIAEIALAGGTAAGATRMGRGALAAAAEAGLARRAAQEWAKKPLKVRAGGRSLWVEKNIKTRGDAWSRFDAERTGFDETPDNFLTFDQVSHDRTIAISNKTLDLALANYSRTDKRAIFTATKRYIDQVANFRVGGGNTSKIIRKELTQRRLHLLLPAGEALPGQTLQLTAAEAYAESRGVILQVEYAR